jgi:uncharacterized lipoprotein YmbA
MARLRLLAGGVTLLAAAGCLSLGGGSRPTSFYLLSSLDPGEVVIGSDAVSLGVGPVELPAHLDRPQIVTRAEGNRLELAEFHHWAEPLRDNLTRVLADDLSVLLGTDRVWTYPWRRAAEVDYRVRVEVERFAAGPDPEVHLRGRWILSDAGGRPLATRRSSLRVPVSSLSDYAAVVEAMSRSVEELAGQMAAAIRE